MTGQIRDIASIHGFIMAGNATVTVENEASGARFTFEAKKPWNFETNQRDFSGPVFIKLLNGPDNTADYVNLGMVRQAEPFTVAQHKACRVSPEAPSFKAISYVLAHAKVGRELPESVHVYHEGKCGRCGRKLTVPESIERGIGPECAGKM